MHEDIDVQDYMNFVLTRNHNGKVWRISDNSTKHFVQPLMLTRHTFYLYDGYKTATTAVETFIFFCYLKKEF